MQLLATTYHNIWPFLDRTITVAFHKGKYLIKAVIGSGKSFMFFDGPVFGLYKYSGRTMLSMKAKEGSIKALFESGDNVWLVVRGLSRTKSGWDSVKSKLFEVVWEKSDILHIVSGISSIVNEDMDIEDMLREKWIKLEEVVFKNETDLQQNLTDFLPPREVFTSTTFLMQDSENMFEMTPADRINVFKNIFWLLNIDEAKDVISDAKKEATALLKSRRNTDDVNTKLQRLVHEYINIVSASHEQLSDDIISHANDRELVHEKLGVENFDIASLPLASWQEMMMNYDKQRLDFQSRQGRLQELQKQVFGKESEISTAQRQKQDDERKIADLQKKLETNFDSEIKKIKEQKADYIAEQEKIINTLELGQFGFSKIIELSNYISGLKENGKWLKENKKILWEKLEKAQKNEDSVKAKVEAMQKGAPTTDEKKDILHSIIDEWCTSHDCEVLKKLEKHFGEIQGQKRFLEEQIKNELERAHQETIDVKQQLDETEKALADLKHKWESETLTPKETSIDHYYTLDEKRQKADKELVTLEQKQQSQDDQKKELLLLQSRSTHYDETILSLQKQLQEISEELVKAQAETDINQLDKIEAMLTSIAKAMKLLEAVNDLVATHKNNMLMIKQLEERETMLGQLYNIFSKEIMIYVLQQTLPLFADVLNNLLAKVVDYSVSFETNANSDKIELEIKVHDAKWERLVKSLSWGQKTVLRLTWTLAICIFTRSNALFLDETVNNIDRDTIGKVADLIEDFTKTHDVTFYIITHSEAIQEMEIWDKVISL